jgi:hypothetical protein
MTSDEIKTKIQEHESLQKQIKWWRWGTSGAVVLITILSVASLANEVRDLFQPGPAQQQFAGTLSDGLKRDVLPSVTDMARQALTDSKPEVQAAFAKLNTRVPELTSMSLKQFDILQKELPEQGDKALQATYGDMLKREEPKIKAAYPDATDASIQALVTNMTAEGQAQIVSANDTLFSKHMAALNSIETDITKIQDTEPVTADEDKANWEMALLVVDNFHSDLQGLQSQSDNTPKSVNGKAGKDDKK